MSSETSRLRGGMTLIHVSDNSTLFPIRLTMNTRADPDLDWRQRKSTRLNIVLTHPNPRAGLGKYCPLPWAEHRLPSCLHRTHPFPSERDISMFGDWHGGRDD